MEAESMSVTEQIIEKSEKLFKPQRPGDIRDSLAGIEKARKDFSYNPTTDIISGLEKTVKWIKEQKRSV